MKTLFKAMAVLSVVVCSSIWSSGGNVYRKYDVRNGLTDNSVNDILQDSTGYLWFAGKDGLNRFNGREFVAYGSLESGFYLNISATCLDADHQRIWIATTSSVVLFDPRQGTFEKIASSATDGVSFHQPHKLAMAHDGRLWIAAENGIYSWNGTSLKHYNLASESYARINFCRALFVDRNGNLWAGSLTGLFRYSRIVDRFVLVKGFDTVQSISANEVTEISQSSDGRVWIGTSHGEIHCMDPGMDTFTVLISSATHAGHHSPSAIKSIFEYKPGIFYIGADNGLFILDSSSGTWTPSGDLLEEESICKIFRDKEGGIWFGTLYDGASYFSPKNMGLRWFYDTGGKGSLKGNTVSEFCEDSKGNLWIATLNGGLNYFEPKTERFTDYSGKSSSNINALCLDGNDLWIGTEAFGLDRMNLETGRVRRYRKILGDTSSLSDNRVYALHKDSEGTLWIGTINSVCQYDARHDDFRTVLDTCFISDIAEDAKKNIWIACRNGGIWKYSLMTKKWENLRPMSGRSALSETDRYFRVYIDRDDNPWFCSEDSGIFMYDESKMRFIRHSEAEGLPVTTYYGILEDDDGVFWLSSNHGLIRYDPRSREILNLTKEDGLQSNQFNYKSSLKTRDGKLWFGGMNGFNCFFPKDIYFNRVKPNVMISSVDVHEGDRKTTYSWNDIEKTNGLKLSHKVSAFDINIDCLSYVSPGNNRFEWKFSDSHQWIRTEKGSVSFSGLRPGNYRLLARACNGDGVWSDHSAMLSFRIQPHPLLGRFALTCYALFLIALLFLAYRLVERSRKKRKERTLVEEKIKMFTQIAHEIKTPVTLITSPLDQILEEGRWSEEVETNLKIMKKNSSRLLELIHQLLDFRKADQGFYELTIAPVDLNQLTRDVVMQFRSHRPEIELHCDIPDKLIVYNVDCEAIVKILNNLVSNALKFARKKVVVSLSEEFVPKGRRAVFTVKDDGPGIPPSKREQVFAPFYSSNPRNVAGFGIGLSIVKLLTEKHDGKTWVVDNGIGNGCEVSVAIPYRQTPGMVEDGFPEESPSLKEKASFCKDEPSEDSSKPVILIVEDTPDMMEYIAKNLGDQFGILKAANGMEALQILETRSCDLILSDLLMPQMDGFELLSKIRADETLYYIPFVIVSARDAIETKIKGLDYGADAYVEKPFSMTHLKKTVSSLIENRRLLLKRMASDPYPCVDRTGLRESDQKWLEKAQAVIDENLPNSDFSIEDLCLEMGVSRSILQKKMKSFTGFTPNEYIRMIRLKAAARLLLQNDNKVNEVCYMVGFNTPSYFAKCFAAQFGVFPKDYSQVKASHR